MKRSVSNTKGDATGTIDDLIDFLKTEKEHGATHYEMEWSHDPMQVFKWFVTFKPVTEDEVKQERIKQLRKELDELTS